MIGNQLTTLEAAFYKCGLPHMHLLIFLHSADQFLEASQIDEVICAELPILKTDPT